MGSGWLPVAAPEFFQQFAQWGLALPHCRNLGLQLAAAEKGRATLCLPFKQELIGNPLTRVLHGGVVTTLADTAGAISRSIRCSPNLKPSPRLICASTT